MITLAFHIPDFDALIRANAQSRFHDPLYNWVPSLTALTAVLLIVARHFCSWTLLFGILPRMSAAFLALSGVYVMLLDAENFAHNTHLHLLLLILLACSNDCVSLWRLIRDDAAEVLTVAWPEQLVIIQMSIMFFITTLDKVMSPDWGTTGALLETLKVVDHGVTLEWAEGLVRTTLRRIPGPMSISTILLELFFAVAFLVRPLWRFVIPLTVAFMMFLEFLLRPKLFPWDVMAVLLLMIPAGDRSHTLRYDGRSELWFRLRLILSGLDWHRRLRWETVERNEVEPHIGFTLSNADGKTRVGFDALRSLLLLFPAPMLAMLVIVRFGGFGERILGLIPAYDAALLSFAGLLLLWAPGFSQFVGQPLYAGCSKRLA